MLTIPYLLVLYSLQDVTKQLTIEPFSLQQSNLKLILLSREKGKKESAHSVHDIIEYLSMNSTY